MGDDANAPESSACVENCTASSVGTGLALGRHAVISAVRNGPARRQQVFKSYPFETVIILPAPRRQQIATLIGNLSRTVDILTADIEHEEAGVAARDLLDPTYPVLARSLRTRTDNIRATIASLEALLGEHQAAA